MATPAPDFKNILSENGIPTTQSGVEALLMEELTDAGSIYSNTALISPFKRIFTALIVIPVMWLISALVLGWMPQSFLLTATGVWLDAIAWGLHITRKVAVKTRGYITFNRSDTAGPLVIPAGTIVNSIAIDGRVYSLVVLTETTMADSIGTVNVLCEAAEAGSSYNLAEGLYSIVPASLPTITSVINDADWLVQPGSNEEKDDELRNRCRNAFSAINQWHTDAVYRSIISSFDGVISTNVYFDNDAPRGPGTCDAYVLMETGNPGSVFLHGIKDEIMLNGNHGHGDDVALLAMPETNHAIVATVWPVDGLSVDEKTALISSIETFIRCAFRENSSYPITVDNRPVCTRVQPFDRFSFSRLCKELHQQFSNLDSIDFTTTDIVSGMNIPRISTITMTEGA